MSSHMKGLSSIVIASLMYSFFGVFAKIIGFKLDLFYAGFSRGVFALIIMSPYLFVKGNWLSVSRRDWVWIGVRAFFGAMVAFIANYYAFYNLAIGTAYFIFYAGSTIGGYFFGKVLFAETLGLKKIISLILCIIGMITIYASNAEIGAPFYMFLAFIGGSAPAVWNTFSKKVSGKYSAYQLNFLDMLFATLFFLMFSLSAQEAWILPEVNEIWVANALFSLMFVFTGQLIIWGFKYLEAQIASIVLLAEIIFGIIFGYLFFQETLTAFTIIGGLIVIIAIIFSELQLIPKSTKGESA